jgi:hypothetical protein
MQPHEEQEETHNYFKNRIAVICGSNSHPEPFDKPLRVNSVAGIFGKPNR